MAARKEADDQGAFERVVAYFLGRQKPKEEPKAKPRKRKPTSKKPSTKAKKRA